MYKLRYRIQNLDKKIRCFQYCIVLKCVIWIENIYPYDPLIYTVLHTLYYIIGVADVAHLGWVEK